MSKSSFGSITARTASISRVGAGKPHAWSKCSKRTSRSRSSTPQSARHGKFTSASAFAKPLRVSAGCLRSCHSKALEHRSPANIGPAESAMLGMKAMIGGLSAMALGGLITLSVSHAVRSEAATEYFAGKQFSLFIGTTAGGGYDLYARTLARHIARH